jgi:predicted nucleic acid-binding Zn ribbon protein
MPTYEFRCPDGTIVERIFKMSDVPQSIPSPHGDGVAVRIISGGADLIFKGSGFYITDYGKDGKRDQREKAGAASEKSGEPKAESKPDTKVEGKGEAKSPKGESKADTPAAAPKTESKPKPVAKAPDKSE